MIKCSKNAYHLITTLNKRRHKTIAFDRKIILLYPARELLSFTDHSAITVFFFKLLLRLRLNEKIIVLWPIRVHSINQCRLLAMGVTMVPRHPSLRVRLNIILVFFFYTFSVSLSHYLFSSLSTSLSSQ